MGTRNKQLAARIVRVGDIFLTTELILDTFGCFPFSSWYSLIVFCMNERKMKINLPFTVEFTHRFLRFVQSASFQGGTAFQGTHFCSRNQRPTSGQNKGDTFLTNFQVVLPYTIILIFPFPLLHRMQHRINIELDSKVYLGSMCTAVLVGWRHLFVTPLDAVISCVPCFIESSTGCCVFFVQHGSPLMFLQRDGILNF